MLCRTAEGLAISRRRGTASHTPRDSHGEADEGRCEEKGERTHCGVSAGAAGSKMRSWRGFARRWDAQRAWALARTVHPRNSSFLPTRNVRAKRGCCHRVIPPIVPEAALTRRRWMRNRKTAAGSHPRPLAPAREASPPLRARSTSCSRSVASQAPRLPGSGRVISQAALHRARCQ